MSQDAFDRWARRRARMHAPQIACIGNLYWCICQEPDWAQGPQWSEPGWDEWVDSQPFYQPEEYVSHVMDAVFGGQT